MNNGALNTAINIVSNNTQAGSNKTQIYLLVLVGLAILGLAYYYMKGRSEQNPFLDDSGMLHQAPEQPVAAYNTSEVPTITKESWCLVAEDNSGRYCVKVPGPESCTPDRAYDSQSQCELTPAMKLPAAIQTNGGMTSKPLRDLKVL